MANKVYSYYQDLPSWAKGVVVVGVLGDSYILISQTISRIRKGKDMKASLVESDIAKQELLDLQRKGIHPTLQKSQIETIINSLVDAMNDCGTNTTRVYDAFKKLNNEADLKLLIQNWQVRFYHPCAASQPISYMKYLYDDKSFGGNLSTWLNYDLSSSEISNVNKILSDKKINFKF